MAEYIIQGDTLSAIADAIRAKTGKTAAISPADMAAEVSSIETGGGAGASVDTCSVNIVCDTSDCFFTLGYYTKCENGTVETKQFSYNGNVLDSMTDELYATNVVKGSIIVFKALSSYSTVDGETFSIVSNTLDLNHEFVQYAVIITNDCKIEFTAEK